MKNKRAKIINFVCGLFFFFVASDIYSKTLVIRQYKVKVRKNPVITGPSVGILKHKEVVQELERKKGFVRVQSGKIQGWIPLESVSIDKSVKIKKGRKIETIEDEDLLAAGKGLGDMSNDDSMNESKDSVGKKRLDEIESGSVPKDLDVTKFKSSGGLKPARRGK